MCVLFTNAEKCGNIAVTLWERDCYFTWVIGELIGDNRHKAKRLATGSGVFGSRGIHCTIK